MPQRGDMVRLGCKRALAWSFFCYCAEHLLSDGIDDTHVTKVMPIQDNKGRSANG